MESWRTLPNGDDLVVVGDVLGLPCYIVIYPLQLIQVLKASLVAPSLVWANAELLVLRNREPSDLLVLSPDIVCSSCYKIKSKTPLSELRCVCVTNAQRSILTSPLGISVTGFWTSYTCWFGKATQILLTTIWSQIFLEMLYINKSTNRINKPTGIQKICQKCYCYLKACGRQRCLLSSLL